MTLLLNNPDPVKIDHKTISFKLIMNFQDCIIALRWIVRSWEKLPAALIAVIFVIGTVLLLCFHIQASTGVFFNGDCGVKALQTMQIASGDFRTSLELPATQWEKDLWDEGLYPFDAPFAYRVNSRYFVQYPYFFPLLSAPFYLVFGYRGFYLIPILSTFLMWACLLYAVNRMRCHPLESCLLLLMLIFASPVTLYSAIFGEQNLALLLAFGGVVIFLFQPSQIAQETSSTMAGFLVGIASWFRPELCCLGFAMIISMLICKILRRTAFHPTRFLASFSLSLLILIFHNLIVFHSPFGVRSNEIFSGLSIAERIQVYRLVMYRLWNALLYYFPLAFFPILLAVGSWISRKHKFSSESIFCSSVIVFYVLTVPILVPNFGGKQWPPRYFLILAPLTALLIGSIFFQTRQARRIQAGLLAAALVGVTAWCIRINTFEGLNYLSNDYTHRAAPPLDFLMHSSLRHVAVSNQYLSQEFAFATQSKVFFMPRSQWHLWRLCETIFRRHGDRFMFVCYAFRKPPETVEFLSDKGRLAARFSLIRHFGDPDRVDKYGCILFYTVTLRHQKLAHPASSVLSR